MPTQSSPAPLTRRQCLRNMKGRSQWKQCGEETQAEEPQIGQERAQSEARLGSLAVLQRRIRELLPTLPAAVALGHQAPVRDAPCSHAAETAQLCTGRGARPAGWGVHRAGCGHESGGHTARCRPRAAAGRHAAGPGVSSSTTNSSMPYTRCCAARTGMSPSWTSSGGPLPSCRCRRSSMSSSRRSRMSSSTSPRLQRTLSPPRLRGRKE